MEQSDVPRRWRAGWGYCLWKGVGYFLFFFFFFFGVHWWRVAVVAVLWARLGPLSIVTVVDVYEAKNSFCTVFFFFFFFFLVVVVGGSRYWNKGNRNPRARPCPPACHTTSRITGVPPGPTVESLTKEKEDMQIELEREREQRNYYQLERDRINTFWEVRPPSRARVWCGGWGKWVGREIRCTGDG